MSVVEIVDPIEQDWTAEWLVEQGFAPYYAGDDWTLRGQVRAYDGPDDHVGEAVSLSGALIAMAVTTSDHDATVLLTRRSDTDIVGSSPLRRQIAIDADQSAEGGTALAPTGKGWFTIRFGREAADAAAALLAVGIRPFGVRILFGDGSKGTWARGHFEIGEPIPATIAAL